MDLPNKALDIYEVTKPYLAALLLSLAAVWLVKAATLKFKAVYSRKPSASRGRRSPDPEKSSVPAVVGTPWKATDRKPGGGFPVSLPSNTTAYNIRMAPFIFQTPNSPCVPRLVRPRHQAPPLPPLPLRPSLQCNNGLASNAMGRLDRDRQPLA